MTISHRESFPLPWVERYRPQKLEDVLSQNDIIQTLTRFIESGQLPHLLLHGPPGTGKTSTVQAIAQKLYGSDYQQMVLELNASDDRGIATVRDTIKVFAETTSHLSSIRKEQPNASHLNRIKLIILDEADQMTGAAQMALRRIIENYTHVVRFFIICNYMNKINPALQSRCTKFRFPPVKPSDIEARIKSISVSESVTLTDDGMKTLIRISQGDMRKILNYLQSASLCLSRKQEPVNENAVLETAGLPLPEKIEEIFHHLRCSSFQKGYIEIKQILKTHGYSLSDIVSNIYERLILLDLPITVSGVALPTLADIEYQLSQGANEAIQLGGLVALFIQIRQALVSCTKTSNNS